MQIHTLQRNTKNKSTKRVGRGGARGQQSGRGHKGQKQHGLRIRPALRDMIKKIPKLRGRGIHPNKPIQAKPNTINLGQIDAHFTDGEIVSALTLLQKGLIQDKDLSAGLKILGTGEMTKKVTFEGCEFSKTAAEKIKGK